MRHGFTCSRHHALEQFCTNDRSLWLDLCGLSLAGASLDAELLAPILHYYTGADLHVFLEMKRILIMGLPGAGKTTLAKAMADKINAMWFNADDVRKQCNDWDFSHQGRIRQSQRMRDLADDSHAKFVICDFVAPLAEMRTVYDADYTIWMDTITEGRFANTNQIFEPPEKYNMRIKDFNYSVDDIIKELL